MNKILVYTIFAILLGTIIMTAPLALLEPTQSLLHTTEEDNSKILEFDRDTLQSNDMWTNQTLGESNGEHTSESDPEHTTQPSVPPEPLPEEPRLVDSTYDDSLTVSGLYPLGVMIVPSFLVALGIFVYFKKHVN